jgi:hypothetical protein
MSGIFSANLDDLINLKHFLDHIDSVSDDLQAKLKGYWNAVDGSYNGPNKASLDSDLQCMYQYFLDIDNYADKIRYALQQVINDIEQAEGVHL